MVRFMSRFIGAERLDLIVFLSHLHYDIRIDEKVDKKECFFGLIYE